jgi:hypothetical protein
MGFKGKSRIEFLPGSWVGIRDVESCDDDPPAVEEAKASRASAASGLAF